MSYGPDKIRLRIGLSLVAGALACTLLAIGSVWVQQTVSGDRAMSGKVLPEFTADMPQVRTITIATRNGPYNLVRHGTMWVMPERGNYRVAPAALSELAKGLSDLSYKAARTSDPSQFARLGVDDPGPDSDGVLLSLKGASNQILSSLYIGKKADAIFVRNAGSNDVFEALGKLPDFGSPALWLDLKVIDVMPETIASVSGQRIGEEQYDIVRRPDGGFAPVGGAANVTATTAAIALTKWAPIDVMASNGLTTAPIATHTTSLRSGVIIQANLYQEAGQNWVVLSALTNLADQNDAVLQLNRRTDGWAFAVNAAQFADMTFAKNAVLNGPAADGGN